MPQTATIKSLPEAFEVVKAMQTDGLDWGEGYRPAPPGESGQTPAQGPQAHNTRRDRPTRHPLACDAELYKRRSLVERMFGRIKDWRRIATRYDRCARTFAICIAATVIF